jgi:recombination protein RecR
MQHEIEQLTIMLRRLPGLGPRSAKRVILHLLKKPDSLMTPLADLIAKTADRVVTCHICGNFDVQSPCEICQDSARDRSTICVVEEVDDLWALESTNSYNGLYHVLGGILSPLDGIGPEDLNIPGLLERLSKSHVNELIMALGATVDGQSTAHYITDHLDGTDINITRLSHGVPVGGELDYLDEGTLITALKSRRPVGEDTDKDRQKANL